MLRISVNTGSELLERVHEGGALEIGRGCQRATPRLVVSQPHISRDHVLLEEIEPGLVRIENISRKNPIWLNRSSRLEIGASLVVPLPVVLRIGATTIEIEAYQPSESPGLRTIRAPVDQRGSAAATSLRALGEAPAADQLTEWLERAIHVQRAAAGSPDFFAEAAQAVVDLVGLDSSCVLLRERESWRVVARWPEHWEGEVDFSHSILGEVAANRRTFFETFRLPHDSQSLRQIEAVVASPILNEQQQLMGVLYGSRRYGSGEADAITPLEAQFVQLLAAAVAAGLMRQEREVEAARLRVQFEQFFSPGLAAELERDPGLLEARARDITMLFADLRGFSGLAERIGPRETFRLMADVLDRLTAVLVAEGGVIIDYYGDGVAVMWNAPLDQPAHAAMACRAAGGLLNELPALNQAWSATLGRELALGIGIHTGTALVGNSGSRKRLKYGPRGHTVNVASRLEQATKQVGLPVLLSEAAAVGLTNQVAVRRICRARLQGMSAPVVLYTLADAAGESGQEERYQHAVALFESRQTAEARRELASLAASGHALSQVLLNHLAQMPDDATGTYGGVLDLTEK